MAEQPEVLLHTPRCDDTHELLDGRMRGERRDLFFVQRLHNVWRGRGFLRNRVDRRVICPDLRRLQTDGVRHPAFLAVLEDTPKIAQP